MKHQNKLYPHPAIVVGLGKFGLASLEFLGEKWISRKATGGDNSLRNLRLVHADFDEKQFTSKDWSNTEQRISNFLAQVRSDDMPMQALDMLILRTMGLVRFYNGAYEVCSPKDGGFISVVQEDGLFRFPTADEKGSENTETNNDDKSTKLYRRKYFEWLTLGTDPIAAVQNLAALRLSDPEYDNFVGAILHRVKLGHSPQIILRMIFRSEQLCKFASDPSPWSWVAEMQSEYQQTYDCSADESDGEEDTEGEPPPELKVNIDINDNIRYREFLNTKDDPEMRNTATAHKVSLQAVNLQQAWGDFLPMPMSEWSDETKTLTNKPIVVPQCNLYRNEFVSQNALSICTTPYHEMYTILQQDFARMDAEAIRLLPVPDFHLGMMDHDIWTREEGYYKHLNHRLKEYGRLTYQGLVLLWSELEQAYTTEMTAARESHSAALAKSVKQSLGFLGELMVKQLLFDDRPDVMGGTNQEKRQPSDIWTDGIDLPTDASNQLQRAQIANYSGFAEDIQQLYARLIEIGVPLEDNQELTRGLYSRVNFEPRHLDVHLHDQIQGEIRASSDEPDTNTFHISDQDYLENSAMLALRKQINAELRHLYNLDNLRQVNKGIHRTPPKLKVFVVADFHDPFSRVALQPILKCVSAEVFRVVNSIFQIERGGVFSNTSIVPLVWTPNPTDPTAGSDLTREKRNRESVVSLHAIHSLRKWLESIPEHSCNIRQVFLNSRTTDNAYLGTREAVTQTSHFIEYQVSNTFLDVPELDATRAFIRPNALFASFACHLVDFPETRTREYLATMLGLDFLDRLRHNRYQIDDVFDFGDVEVDQEHQSMQNDTETELLDYIANSLDRNSERNRAKYIVKFPNEETPLSTIYSTLTDEHLNDIKREVIRTWNAFVADAGQLDSIIREYHIRTQRHCHKHLEEQFEKTNEAFIEKASAQGIDKARQFLGQTKMDRDENLRDFDLELSEKGRECKKEGIPKLSGLESLYEYIKTTALERLDVSAARSLTVLLVLWLFIGFGPLVWIVLQALDLPMSPSIGEWIAWKVLPWILVGGTTTLLLRLLEQQVRQFHERFVQASVAFDNRLHEFYVADTNSLNAFFRSRSQLSLVTKQREQFANSVEQASFDQRLGERMQQSVDLQETLLQQHLEDLGVRLTSGTLADQDPSQLFNIYAAAYNTNLLDPEIIKEFYNISYPAESQRFWKNKVTEMLSELGGLDRWRWEAPLSNTKVILDYGRNEEEFRRFIEQPLIQLQETIQKNLFVNIVDFILENHPNLGLGADFDGYRGLDTDGVGSISCVLVLHDDMHKGLKRVMEDFQEMHHERSNDAKRVHQIISNAMTSQEVRPNAVCLYSIATGISTRIIQNLKRYNTPLERVEPALDTLFPYGSNVSSFKRSKEHLNPLLPFGTIRFDWVESDHVDLPPVEPDPSDDSLSDDGSSDALTDGPDAPTLESDDSGDGETGAE